LIHTLVEGRGLLIFDGDTPIRLVTLGELIAA